MFGQGTAASAAKEEIEQEVRGIGLAKQISGLLERRGLVYAQWKQVEKLIEAMDEKIGKLEEELKKAL